MSTPIEARWAELSPLLDQLLELPSVSRTEWIDAHVADAQLRELLEAMLSAEDTTGMLDRPGDEYARILIEGEPQPAVVERSACPYRLLRKLGEGGMASVYLAERADGAFAQQVAVKLMRVGILDPYERERFSRERQILARLEHPHIARLLDGGLTAEGVPWIALEYVPGEPIVRFCDTRRFDLRDRLRLFMLVCDAVQFAHQVLIVHRDLKPNNILVRADGTPKLLDFGIAKLLDDEAEAADSTRTEYRRLTPGYAAPEQFTDAPVTTATDIYTLGVLLHELLTGRKPVARGDDTLRLPSTMFSGEADATMRARERASTPHALKRHLAGDLDCILLKALRFDPARRYTSVAELREDISRHLDGDPIHARPDAWSYRAGKFLQQHTFALAAAATVLVVLILATAFSLHEARVVRAASMLADREAKDAAAENDFLISTFEAANPFNTQGAPLTARELLENTASRIDTEFGDNWRVGAKLHQAMGEIFFSFKRSAQARREYQAALDALTHFLPPDSAEILEARIIVQVQRLMQGDVAGAIAELEQIQTIAANRGGDYVHAHYRAQENIALAMTMRGDYARATQISESLLAEANELAAKGIRTYAKYNLASDYLQQERLEPATRAIDDLSAHDVGTGPAPPGLLFHLRDIAELMLELGRLHDAQGLFERLMAATSQAPDLQSWFSAEDFAHAGIVLDGLGDARAAAMFRAAFDAFEKTKDGFPPLLVDAEYGDARALIAAGRFDEASMRLNRLIEMHRQFGFPQHPIVLAARSALAEIAIERGAADAEQSLRAIADLQRKDTDRELPYTLLALARAAQRRGDTAQVQGFIDETLNVLRQQNRPWHPFAYRAYRLRAELADAAHDAATARRARLHALASAGIAFGAEHSRTRELLVALGARSDGAARELLQQAAQLAGPAPAEDLYRRALQMLARVETPAAGTPATVQTARQ